MGNSVAVLLQIYYSICVPKIIKVQCGLTKLLQKRCNFLPHSVERRGCTRRCKKYDDMFARFDRIHERDRQTDRQRAMAGHVPQFSTRMLYDREHPSVALISDKSS